MNSRRREMRPPLPSVSIPRWAWITLAVLVAVLAGVAIVLSVDAIRAKAALESATERAQILERQLSDGNAESADLTLGGLQGDTNRARDLTEGPLWSLATHVPWFGDDVVAIQTATASVDRIADKAIPPVTTVVEAVQANAFSPRDGRIDIEGLTRIEPDVAAANTILTAERKRIDALDPSRLVGPLARQIRELQDKVGQAHGSVRAAAVATRLAPQLLGADEPRRYLLVFQNNAEIRSTGGLNGAFVVLTADDGRLTIDEPGSNGDLLGGIEEPVLRLSEDEKLIYPTAMGTDFRNTGFTPDFPRSAALQRAIVERKLGTEVSGVLSMDPVALSYVLRGTGPIELVDGTTLTPENAVRVLLNEVYFTIPEPRLQDAYFASATQRIFAQAMDGTGDATLVMRALAQGVSERRVMFWSADPKEQAQIAGSALANELPVTTATPTYGVYLTDSTLAKMQYYLDFNSTVRATQCAAGGVQTLVSTTTLTSHAPKDPDDLPDYVTGNSGKTPTGSQRVIVRLYGSAGGAFTELLVDGLEQQVYGLQHEGRPVTYAVVDIKPGDTVRIRATSVTGRGQQRDGLFLTTPGLKAFQNATSIRSACG